MDSLGNSLYMDGVAPVSNDQAESLKHNDQLLL